MTTIHVPLTNRETPALISEQDSHLLQHTWCDNGDGYVVTKINGRRVYLHRAVAELKGDILGGRALPVEHLNHQKYDCRRENLRVTSISHNTRRTYRKGFIKNDGHGKWAYAGFVFKQKKYLVARTLKQNDLSILSHLAEVASERLMQLHDLNPDLTHEEVDKEFPMVTV